MAKVIPPKRRYWAIFLTALSFVLIQCVIELVFIYTAVSYSIDIASGLYAERYVLIVIHLALTIWLIVFAKAFSEKFYRHRRNNL
ncbi:MAG: hypothetical protein AAB503_01535 [Patescibacteria group bacterium]